MAMASQRRAAATATKTTNTWFDDDFIWEFLECLEGSSAIRLVGLRRLCGQRRTPNNPGGRSRFYLCYLSDACICDYLLTSLDHGRVELEYLRVDTLVLGALSGRVVLFSVSSISIGAIVQHHKHHIFLPVRCGNISRERQDFNRGTSAATATGYSLQSPAPAPCHFLFLRTAVV